MEGHLRKALLVLGAIAILFGLLWLLQGLGLIDLFTQVPADLARTGGLVTVLGAVMLWLGRRMGMPTR